MTNEPIPVTDRLPEVGRNVLAFVVCKASKKGEWDIASCYDGKWELSEYWWTFGGVVTHWQPLPVDPPHVEIPDDPEPPPREPTDLSYGSIVTITREDLVGDDYWYLGPPEPMETEQ